MSSRFDRVVTVVLAVSAFTVATAAVRNSFVKRDEPGRDAKPVYVDAWKDALPIGRSVGGSSNAPVTVVAFYDLECPACAGFHTKLMGAISARPNIVQGVYVHFPLSYHRFAVGAARGAECAAHVGRFAEWVDVIFDKRDSLGVKSWGQFARDAGISDTAQLHRCASDSTLDARINAGIALGEKVKVTGTPTVLVNGWRLSGTPSASKLDSVISAIANGDRPR